MPDIYFYIPKEDLDDVVDCGMKLSEYSSFTIPVGSTTYDCMQGYLHPGDAKRQEEDGLVCVRAEVKEQYCYVGDGDLHFLFKRSGNVQEKFERSIVPLKEYKLGTYRNPECYVTCTLIGDAIYDMESGLGAPLLYNSSEDLYYECLETLLIDKCGIRQKDLLSGFFEYLRYQGIFRTENLDHSISIFYNNNMDKYFPIDKADCDDILEKLTYMDLLNDNKKDGE